MRIRLRVRALSHGKFRPGWNFQFQPGLKKVRVTLEFQPGVNECFFTLFHPRVKMYLQKICSIFYKNFLLKKTFRMQLQDYIKTMMLDFINKRSKTFNFKTFKVVLLTTTCIAATKDLWSKKTTRYSCKRCHDFEKYCVWKGQVTKEEVCKKTSTFLALKQFS